MKDSQASATERVLATARTLYCDPAGGHPTMDDVARAAGIGRATLYRYFRNRDELLLSVMEHEAIQIALRVEKQIRRYKQPSQFIIEGMLRAREEILGNELFNALFQSGEGAALNRLLFNSDSLVDIARETMLPVVEIARASGELSSDMDFDTMAEWILRTLLSLITVPSPKLKTRASTRKFLRATMLPVLEG